MNHLISLNAQAGELEKILSGTKSMLIKEIDPAVEHPVKPGDNLYFFRDKDECTLRVKASVVRTRLVTKSQEEDLSQIMKEMQPRLQLTEDQYNYWSAKEQVLLVEFGSAQKITGIHLAAEKTTDRPEWITFEEFGIFP